jgi:hypothetical protein
MKSPELAKLCQALLEILRAAIAANQDQEVKAAQVESTPSKSTEVDEPGAGVSP